MTLRKLGLGLVVSAIGMMAFAASAQAATLGILIEEKPALHATVEGEQEGFGYLLVNALNLELRCEKFSVQEGLILNSLVAHGKLLYENCAPFTLKLEPISTCKVVFSEANKVAHVQATALILPAEFLTAFGMEPALLAEKINAKILFHGEECTLPESNNVTGDLCLEILPKTNYTVKPLVLASDTIQGKCRPRNVLEGTEQNSGGVKDVLKYGAQTANVDGGAWLFLSGEHKGMTFGVKLNP